MEFNRDEACLSATRQSCVFAKALMCGSACCQLVVRQTIGERETLECPKPPAHINCTTLADLFYERATFALRLPRKGDAIAHTLALRLQCGGLNGVSDCLTADEPPVDAGGTAGDAAASVVPDVHRMLLQLTSSGGSLLVLPWDRVVARIVQWQPRRRQAARTITGED